jgi:hypothetical protein
MTPKQRLEKILGGKITPFAEEPLPGLATSQSSEVVYVTDYPGMEIALQLRQIARRIDPPYIKDGGIHATQHALRLPDGRLFHAFRYTGDIEGWRRQVQEGAALLKLSLGWVQAPATFRTSEGIEYELSKCEHLRL